MSLAPLFALLLALRCAAFDTGHHHDLVRNALALKGYGGLGVQIAQERSWLLDYHTLHTNVNGTSQAAGAWPGAGGRAACAGCS